jgi:RNA polymerase sigma-70 factor (ECF subfamily)
MDAEPITTNLDGSAGLDPIQGPHAERIAQIFREHNQSLLQFLAGRLASEQDAKEVAQEAYVRVLQLDKPEGVSFLRTSETHQHYFFDLQFEPSAESRISSAEDATVTIAALGELPARHRAAFLLSRVDGLSTHEIAARMGVGERAIRGYLVRALLHLRTRLQKAHSPQRTR